MADGFDKGVAYCGMILVLGATDISLLVSILSIYGETNTQILTPMRAPARAVMQ